MSTEAEFAAAVDPHRRELLAHCYRMLGSFHDAEDAVQETLVRAWRGYDGFEGRSSLRTWLYRIATRVCLTMAEGRERRVLPSGLSSGLDDGRAPLAARRVEVPWLEPFPHQPDDPSDVVTRRETIRLAFVAALQELPARQRAALLLRDVVGLPAAEVAELLDLSSAAVNSALQRARAHAGQRGEEDRPMTDRIGDKVLARFIAAFEDADVPALAALLRHDVELEMPPIPTWFTGRDAVVEFLATRALSSGHRRAIATSANGCPALVTYNVEPDGTSAAHSVQVLETDGRLITHIYAFRDTAVFALFGFPLTLHD